MNDDFSKRVPSREEFLARELLSAQDEIRRLRDTVKFLVIALAEKSAGVSVDQFAMFPADREIAQ